MPGLFPWRDLIQEIAAQRGKIASSAVFVTNNYHLFRFVIPESFHDLAKQTVVLRSSPFAFNHSRMQSSISVLVKWYFTVLCADAKIA